MPSSPDVRSLSLRDQLDKLIIPDLSDGKIEEITADQVKLLMDKFSNLAMMMAHIESYADTDEGRRELSELGEQTVKNIKDIRERINRSNPQEILEFRQKFLKWLPQQLRYTLGVLKKYYFASEKYKAECVKWQRDPNKLPPSLEGVLDAYAKIS